ncbi:MAG TPA: hypothetical protein VIP54_00045, partial [Microterricola sp.]
YGSARPQRTGETPEDMAFNRRVDVAVLSPQPEAVRELIPDVLANGGKAPAEPAAPAEVPAAPAAAH